MSYWNHRVMAHEYEGGVELQIHEVHYEDDGTPNGYSENPAIVSSDEIQGLAWCLTEMGRCLQKPILWYGDKFPEEYDV